MGLLQQPCELGGRLGQKHRAHGEGDGTSEGSTHALHRTHHVPAVTCHSTSLIIITISSISTAGQSACTHGAKMLQMLRVVEPDEDRQRSSMLGSRDGQG